MTSTERVRDFFKVVNLQVYLEVSRYELVYINKFHLYMKSSAVYKWRLKIYQVILTIEVELWILNFVVAPSRK